MMRRRMRRFGGRRNTDRYRAWRVGTPSSHIPLPAHLIVCCMSGILGAFSFRLLLLFSVVLVQSLTLFLGRVARHVR
jgi:hypothetical protein